MVRFQNRKKSKDNMEALQSDSVPVSGAQSVDPNHSFEEKMAMLISKRINNLHYLQKMKMIKNVMHNLYGRHNPIQYKPDFNFQQNWQNKQRHQKEQDNYNILKTQNTLFITLHSVLCLLYGLMIWFFSIYRLFEINNIFNGIIAIILIIQIIDIIQSQYLVSQLRQEQNMQQNGYSIQDYLNLHHKKVIFIIYLIFLGIQDYLTNKQKIKWLFILDLTFVFMSYHRFKEFYSAIKIKILASKYTNQILILQLFGGCILLVHIFGVVLYIVSFANERVNWTKSIDNFDFNWLSRYVYSLYFACTTALTVGYGDVTPKNLFQIMTVLCVQVIGLINVGYVVNEIGRILSKLNEQQQLFHKNISQAEKITKNYQLPPEIENKMKTYVINNQITSNQLNIEEEDNFVKRLSDQIRTDVTAHNQLRLVKTSVFFLCHWSKKFQRKIADKLERCIYSPQQSITQIHGKEKLYLLTKGKVDIEAFNSKHPSSSLSRCLQSIEIDDKKDVQFNIFGYSALISGLIINLKGIFKDYSICYHVNKEDILKIIVENKNDFEYFHEIKGKIEQSRFKQIFQAPNIANTREHYLPNPYDIIKKDKMKLKKKNKRNNEYRRKNRRQDLHYSQNRQKSEHQIQSQKEFELQSRSVTFAVESEQNNSLLTEKQRNLKYKKSEEGKSSPFLITNRKYRRKNLKKKVSMTELDKQKEQKNCKLINFQEMKQYKSYFPRFNFFKVNQRYINHYNKDKKEGNPVRTSLTKALASLGSPLVDQLISFKKIGSGSANTLKSVTESK